MSRSFVKKDTYIFLEKRSKQSVNRLNRAERHSVAQQLRCGHADPFHFSGIGHNEGKADISGQWLRKGKITAFITTD